MKGGTKCYTHTNASYAAMDQLYAFEGRGVDLEAEGVRYIVMHRGPQTC